MLRRKWTDRDLRLGCDLWCCEGKRDEVIRAKLICLANFNVTIDTSSFVSEACGTRLINELVMGKL